MRQKLFKNPTSLRVIINYICSYPLPRRRVKIDLNRINYHTFILVQCVSLYVNYSRIELLNWIDFSIVWIHDSSNAGEVYQFIEKIYLPLYTANALGDTIFYRNVIDSATNGSGGGTGANLYFLILSSWLRGSSPVVIVSIPSIENSWLFACSRTSINCTVLGH